MPRRWRAAQFALKIIYLIERRFGEGYSRHPGHDRARERVPSRPSEKGGTMPHSGVRTGGRAEKSTSDVCRCSIAESVHSRPRRDVKCPRAKSGREEIEESTTCR